MSSASNFLLKEEDIKHVKTFSWAPVHCHIRYLINFGAGKRPVLSETTPMAWNSLFFLIFQTIFTFIEEIRDLIYCCKPLRIYGISFLEELILATDLRISDVIVTNCEKRELIGVIHSLHYVIRENMALCFASSQVNTTALKH